MTRSGRSLVFPELYICKWCGSSIFYLFIFELSFNECFKIFQCSCPFSCVSQTLCNRIKFSVGRCWGEVIGGEIGQDEAVSGNTNYCCTCWDCLETCDCNEDIVSIRDRILQFGSFMIIICKVVYFLVMVYESAVQTKTLSNCRTIIHYLHKGLFTLYLLISWPTHRKGEGIQGIWHIKA